MGVVPLMDMTVHLAAMHGVAPQPAVNALLLWALANNTFVMNEKTKESLKEICCTSNFDLLREFLTYRGHRMLAGRG